MWALTLSFGDCGIWLCCNLYPNCKILLCHLCLCCCCSVTLIVFFCISIRWDFLKWTDMYSLTMTEQIMIIAQLFFPSKFSSTFILTPLLHSLQNRIQIECPALSSPPAYMLIHWWGRISVCRVRLAGPASNWMVCEVAAVSAQEAAEESEPTTRGMTRVHHTRQSSRGTWLWPSCSTTPLASSVFYLHSYFFTSFAPLKEYPSPPRTNPEEFIWL